MRIRPCRLLARIADPTRPVLDIYPRRVVADTVAGLRACGCTLPTVGGKVDGDAPLAAQPALWALRHRSGEVVPYMQGEHSLVGLETTGSDTTLPAGPGCTA